MKKKIKKETFTNLYDIIQNLEYRIEQLEKENMQMSSEMQKIYKLIGRENSNED
jgi:hypothetical protein